MTRQWSRYAGAAGIVGGLLTVLVSVPSRWYGVGVRDSYVFDPPTFSPLWVDRTAIPVLTVLAALGLLVGLFGLVRRDWPTAGRARRWGGVGSVLGLSFATVGTPILLWFTGSGIEEVIVIFLGLGLVAAGVILLAPSLVVLAFGYLQAERPRIGYAFIGVVIGVPTFAFLAPDTVSSLAASLPIAIAWGLVGTDLLGGPGPVGEGPERATG